jgi:hypothetical protein
MHSANTPTYIIGVMLYPSVNEIAEIADVANFHNDSIEFNIRVARLFLVQHTKTGNFYQMITQYV